ncbi:PKD domain protein [Beggiatoa sp. SS]|nr:PKD domain protein [Beggiatoa sp. SS]
MTFKDARDYTITFKVPDKDGAAKSARKNVKVEAAGKYAALGTIRDEEDNPIAGVSVQVGKKTAVTDATGYWEINSLQEGNYEVIATKDGYTFPVKECALGKAPLTIALNGSTSTDTDGNIVSYAWTANGQTANGQNAELTFNDAGNYTITLKVTDNDGATDQVQKTVIVQEIPNKLPTAALAITPESGEAPLTVALDGSASTDTDGNIVSYAWTANGQTANGQNAELTFNDARDYTITLKVTDNDGATKSATKNVKVEAAGKYAASGTIRDEEDNPIAGVSVQVGKKTAVTDATGYWEINSLQEGNYEVIATKDGYTFPVKECALGKAPLTIALNGSTSTDTDGNIVSYAWTANGPTANGQNAELTFNDAGNYPITP